MTIFSSAFTLDRNLTTDVNVRTGALNVNVVLGVLPTCSDPAYDYAVTMQFHPGTGYGYLDWMINLPYMDLQRRLITSMSGQVRRLKFNEHDCTVEYPPFKNARVLRLPYDFGISYWAAYDDLSRENYDDIGWIWSAITPTGHGLSFQYYDDAEDAQGKPFPAKISNDHGDFISFSQGFVVERLAYVDVVTSLEGKTTTTRITLKNEEGRAWVDSISLPDSFDEVFQFVYEYPKDMPRRLVSVRTPTGLEKIITYTQLPIADSVGFVDAVKKMEIRDMGESPSAPSRVFEYEYSQNNYFGYIPGAKFYEDVDMLFTILDDDYKYTIAESEHTGAGEILKTTRIYNRFHLLEREELSSSGEAFIADVKEYSYPIVAGQALEHQIPQFTLPTAIKRTLTEGGSSSSFTTTQSFNETGYLLTKQTEAGTLEVRTYSVPNVSFSDPTRAYAALSSIEIQPSFVWTAGKRVEFQYGARTGLSGINYPVKTAEVHFSMNEGKATHEYTQCYEYMKGGEGLTPTFYDGALAAKFSIINEGDKMGRQEFKFVDGPEGAKLMEYSYGVGTMVYGGQVQYNRKRQPLVAYDANERQTIYTYNALNQLTQETVYANTAKAQTTTYAYRRWLLDATNDATVTAPGKPAIRYKFNAYGNHVGSQMLMPEGLDIPSGWTTVKTVNYDLRQLAIETVENDFYHLPDSPSGSWQQIKTANSYDAHKRLTRVVHADGVVDEFAYNRGEFTQERRRDGSTTPSERWNYTVDGKIYFYDQFSTDGAGVPVTLRSAFAYDGHGRLARTLDPLPLGSAGPFTITKYLYDYHDRLVVEQSYSSAQWDAEPADPCKRTMYTYDGMLRDWSMGLISALQADSNKADTQFVVATRRFDGAGRLSSEVVAPGRSWTYAYANDGDERPSKVVDPAGLGYEQTFDSSTGVTLTRKLLDTGSQYTFTWDSVNRLSEVRLQDRNAETLSMIGHSYDDFGRKNGETSDAGTWKQVFSIGGRLRSTTLLNSTGGVNCCYDASGRLAKKIYEKPHESIPHRIEIDIAYEGGTMSRISLSDSEAGMTAIIDFTHVDGRETSRTYTVAGQECLKIQTCYADPKTTPKQRSYGIAPLAATLEENYVFDPQNRLSRIDYKKTVGQAVSETSSTFQFDEHDRIKAVSGCTPAGAVDAAYAYRSFADADVADLLTSITEAGDVQPVGYNSGSMSKAAGISELRYTESQKLQHAWNANAADPNDLKVQCSYDAMDRFARSAVSQTRPAALSHGVDYLYMNEVITGERAQPVPADATKAERTLFLRANDVLLGRIVMRPDPPTAEASFAEVFATDSAGSLMGVFSYRGNALLQAIYYNYDAYGQRTEFGRVGEFETQ